MDRIPELMQITDYEKYREVFAEIVDSLPSPRYYLQFMEQLDKHVSAVKKRHIYLVTFTLSRDKEHDYDKVEKFIEKQAQREVLQITKFEYVREEHKDGTPHWHALICSRSPIKKDRFWGYIKSYGSVDVSKNKDSSRNQAQQIESIREYISKFAEPKVIL